MPHPLEEMIWETRDGEKVKLGSMRTRHLDFSLRMIEGRNGMWRAKYLERIKLILLIRQTLVSRSFGADD